MKAKYFIIGLAAALLAGMGATAQTAIHLATAGTLKDTSGIKTVTHLTLTGVIDTRDVKFMRDSMVVLAELDLSGATVVRYEGKNGTSSSSSSSVAYPANEMPQYSFCRNSTGKTTLISVKLPAGLTSIGEMAFSNCSGLKELTLPAGLTAIGSDAFYNCSGLEELTLPAGLTAIGSYAFQSCSGLKELTFPAGLTSIGSYAFQSCSGLDSVTNLSLTPQHIENSVFDGVSIENIALTVPDSAVASYKSANVWKDFGSSSSNGITGGGVLLSVKPSNAALGSVSGVLLSGLYPAGTAVSVTAAPASGYSFWGWTSGGATLSASATLSFTLTQDTIITASFGKSGSYKLAEAGTLKDMSGIESVTHLTLTGAIDARDVKFMRNAMPFLTELDLSEAIVVAYEGEGGTYPWGYYSYPANEMPQH
ncbi:MAG: leucine-rich repeat protein, partial [Prevotellaceae bacterium]|nr:leucine-rich repeat protein [Prevotellaceae bacterium]